MKKLFTLVIFFIFIFIDAQKIGIVYDINPSLGYTISRNFPSFKPISEQKLDFNYIDFISDYLSSQNVEYKIYDDFDFSYIDFINRNSIQKNQINYVNNYCKEKGLEKLIIIKKNNTYSGVLDTMKDLHNNTYNYGFMTLKQYKKRSLFYVNFLVLEYNLGDKNYDNFINTVFINKKFKEELYKEDFTFKNDIAMNYHLNLFKENAKKSFDKLIKINNDKN